MADPQPRPTFPTRPRRTWRRRVAFAAGGLALGVLAVLGVLEVLARTVLPQTGIWFAADPELGYRAIPRLTFRYEKDEFRNVVHLNSLGLNDEEIGPKHEGVPRVVVLGDSFVQGLEVPREENLTSVAQRLLHERAAWAELINMGTAGYGTAQELLLLERVGFPLSPDVVVLCVSDNDPYDNYEPLKRWSFIPYFRLEDDGRLTFVPPQTSPGRLSGILAHVPLRSLLLLRSLTWNMDSLRKLTVRFGLAGQRTDQHMRATDLLNAYTVESDEHAAAAWSVTRAIIRRMRERTTEAGATLALVLVPSKFRNLPSKLAWYRENFEGYDDSAYDPELPARTLRALAAELGVPFLDLGASFDEIPAERRGRLFFNADSHWNAAGHAVGGERLAEFLLKERLVRASAVPEASSGTARQ